MNLGKLFVFFIDLIDMASTEYTQEETNNKTITSGEYTSKNSYKRKDLIISTKTQLEFIPKHRKYFNSESLDVKSQNQHANSNKTPNPCRDVKFSDCVNSTISGKYVYSLNGAITGTFTYELYAGEINNFFKGTITEDIMKKAIPELSKLVHDVIGKLDSSFLNFNHDDQRSQNDKTEEKLNNSGVPCKQDEVVDDAKSEDSSYELVMDVKEQSLEEYLNG